MSHMRGAGACLAGTRAQQGGASRKGARPPGILMLRGCVPVGGSVQSTCSAAVDSGSIVGRNAVAEGH